LGKQQPTPPPPVWENCSPQQQQQQQQEFNMSLGNYKIATLEFREFGKLQNHYPGVYGQ